MYLFADLQVFLSKVHGLVMVPQCSVSISKTPACTALPNPASKPNFNTYIRVRKHELKYRKHQHEFFFL